jgi:hypothetical protein
MDLHVERDSTWRSLVASLLGMTVYADATH